MSFDIEHFLGLVQPGTLPAPPGASVSYAFTTGSVWLGGGAGPHSGDPDEIDFGEGPPSGDFMECFHVGPFPGRHPVMQEDPGLWVNQPAVIDLDFTTTEGLPASGGGVTVPWSALATQPDYVTLEVIANRGAGAHTARTLDDVSPAQITCPVIHPVPGELGDDPPYEEVEPATFADISWDMSFAMSGATFVPHNDGSVDQDGQTTGLAGYLRRGSAAYTRDTANTASDFLWPLSEVATIVWTAYGDFHKAELLNGLTLVVRPYWKRTGFVTCFV